MVWFIPSLVHLSRWRRIFQQVLPRLHIWNSGSFVEMQVQKAPISLASWYHNLYRISDDVTINLRWMMERSGPYDTTINSGRCTKECIYMYIYYIKIYIISAWVPRNILCRGYLTWGSKYVPWRVWDLTLYIIPSGMRNPLIFGYRYAQFCCRIYPIENHEVQFYRYNIENVAWGSRM